MVRTFHLPPRDCRTAHPPVRRRLATLLVALAAVAWMMQAVTQPRAIDGLAAAFGLRRHAADPAPRAFAAAVDGGDAGASFDAPAESPLATATSPQPPSAEDFAASAPREDVGSAAAGPAAWPPSSSAAAERPAAPSRPASDPWSAVTDNAVFLAEEQAAWWELLGRVGGGAPRREPADAAQGGPPEETSYVQLLKQPAAYRGQLVRVRGTAVRCESVRPAANPLGLTGYDRLWIAPVGGGEWPLVVYAVDLPPEFPRGAAIREAVEANGYFFKVWSYPYPGGMGLAPVLVSGEVRWRSAEARRRPAARGAPGDWPLWAGGGLVLGALATAWAGWRTRRRRSPAAPAAAVALDEHALRRDDRRAGEETAPSAWCVDLPDPSARAERRGEPPS